MVLTDLSRFLGATLTGLENVSLGVLRPAAEAFDSVCGNAGGGVPAVAENSIFNDQSPHGGPFGANSPFNPDSLAPPKIVLNGQVVGHLSVSPFVADPVDPFELLESLGCPVAPG